MDTRAIREFTGSNPSVELDSMGFIRQVFGRQKPHSIDERSTPTEARNECPES